MRKEAVNTFSEGLVMDLNPLTTPSTVMTSCLNGTIITYNGNEFILQNDMGNGRVETAYLPAGYVPIGIKEHGGIIYVASYNPLTNKGQIGSFPSPERNISSNEVTQLDKTIAYTDFIDENGNLLSAVYKVNLFGQSNELVLRSGDKFGIVISGGMGPDELRTYISNYLNVKNGKVISPKNKMLTLRACIIDANNNLRDITPQLKRVKVEEEEYSIMEFDEQDSQLLKENSGFFATPTKFKENMDVDDYRKSHAFNVYNNKVFGQLYIVASLNTIQRVDFSISGEKNGNLAKLQLIMTYYYNCPDGFFGDSTKEERYLNLYDRYETIYGKEDDFADKNLIKGYEFYIDGVGNISIGFPIINRVEDVEYLESENLYKVTNIYNLDVPIEDQDSDVREFSAVPAMTYAELPGLTVNGAINLAKLGSGEINLNNWRYYCTEDTITLTWGFEAYLKVGQVIEDLHLEFYDIESRVKTYDFAPTKKYNYNGMFTDVIGYQDGLQYQKLYLVIVNCRLNTKDSSGQNETKMFARWLLTTSLYNEQYFSTNDFGEFSETQLNNDNFTGLNDVNFNINHQVKDVSRDPSIALEPYSPNLASQEDQIIMGYKTNSVVMQIDQSVEYKDAAKYPFSLPNGRYSAQYTPSQDSTIKWNGIVGGAGKTPESVRVNETSNNQSDWESNSFDIMTNVLLVEVTDSNKVLVRYKAPSFILGEKFNTERTITYNKVLSKYSDRAESIFGGIANTTSIIPQYAVQLVFREKRKSGPADRHGYGYFPIQYMNGWSFVRLYQEHEDYAAADDADKTIIYYAKDTWNKFVTEGIRSAIGFNPIIMFMTFKTATTPEEMGRYFKPNQGHMRKGGSNIKSLALWFNGTDYGMMKGFSTTLTGTSSMLGKLQSDFQQLYIRQSNIEPKTGYLIDPATSSCVTGGSFNIVASIRASLKPNDSVHGLPEYLLNLEETLNLIKNDAKLPIDVDSLAKLMTFRFNEKAVIDLPIQLEDQLADMQSIFSGIRLLSDNPLIDTPVILDGNAIYQQDSNGNAIDEYQIYTKVNNAMSPINTVGGPLRDYDTAFNVKLLNDEYHLVPKTFNSGNPGIDAASDGSSDSNSILSFSGIKMVNFSR